MSDIDLCIISVSAIISIETPRHLLLLLLIKVSPHRRKICSFVCLISIISQELIIKLLFRGPQQINICDWGYLAHQNKSRWRKVVEGGGGGGTIFSVRPGLAWPALCGAACEGGPGL